MPLRESEGASRSTMYSTRRSMEGAVEARPWGVSPMVWNDVALCEDMA